MHCIRDIVCPDVELPYQWSEVAGGMWCGCSATKVAVAPPHYTAELTGPRSRFHLKFEIDLNHVKNYFSVLSCLLVFRSNKWKSYQRFIKPNGSVRLLVFTMREKWWRTDEIDLHCNRGIVSKTRFFFFCYGFLAKFHGVHGKLYIVYIFQWFLHQVARRSIGLFIWSIRLVVGWPP